MRLPWVKWYPADWSSEPGLRLCCASTRGIWAEALNTMMLRGSDRVEGTVQQLSRLCCCEQTEMATGIQELCEQNVAMVCEQNGNITIVNRRMARELEIKKLRSEAGRKSAAKRQLVKEQRLQHRSASASEYASASVSKNRCTEEESVEYCTVQGLTEDDGKWFFDKCEGSGWKNSGKVIADWKATIRSWKRVGTIFPSQKNGNGQNGQTMSNGRQRQMSAFEIEKRTKAITEEIDSLWKTNVIEEPNGTKSLPKFVREQIDGLKKRRNELQKELLL